MKNIIYFLLIIPALMLMGCITGADVDSDALPGTTADPENGSPPIPEPTPEPTPKPTVKPMPELTPRPTREPPPDPTPDPTPEPSPIPTFGFIDAHADTISRALLRQPNNRGLYRNSTLDVDFERLSKFDAPV
ncbi:MAG: hypothetical protein LBD23_02930, partial [Oscillospiraceae bacterium]|nr:hypothetical protein [Oscillospiraceae bacterium]